MVFQDPTPGATPFALTVGRKTPGDGKLEISPRLAEELGGEGAQVAITLRGNTLTGRVSVLECTCAKAAAGGKHEHNFLQCDAFRDLPVGRELHVSAEPQRLIIAEA